MTDGVTCLRYGFTKRSIDCTCWCQFLVISSVYRDFSARLKGFNRDAKTREFL
jgi:hypothetical protein